MSSAKAERTRQVSKRELQAALGDFIQSSLRRSEMLSKRTSIIEELNTRDSDIICGPIFDPAIHEIETKNIKQSVKLQVEGSKTIGKLLMMVESKVASSARRLASSTEILHLLEKDLAIAHSQNHALTLAN